MIYKKFKKVLNEFRDKSENLQKQSDQIYEQNRKIILQGLELEWAHIYHDTIRGKEWLEKLAISQADGQ